MSICEMGTAHLPYNCMYTPYKCMYRISVRITAECPLIPFSAGKNDCMYVISDGSANAEALGPLKWPLSTTGGKWMFGSHWSLLGPRASALGEVELITLSAFIFSTDYGNRVNSAVIA